MRRLTLSSACSLVLIAGPALAQQFAHAGKRHSPPLRGPALLAPLDLEGDGDLDLLVATADGPVCLRNDGAARFDLHPAGCGAITGLLAASGDFDGDGDQDVVTAWNRLQLFLNDGTGVLTEAAGRFGQATAVALAVADVDGDRDLDVLVPGGGPGRVLELHRNDGTGHFAVSRFVSPALFLPLRIATADVDVDGDTDVLLSELAGVLLVLENDGSGRFSIGAGSMALSVAQPHHIAVGDVDRDGDPDLAVEVHLQPSMPAIAVLHNSGAGTFHPAWLGSFPFVSGVSEFPTLVDVDADGWLDLATSGGYRRNDRTGRFPGPAATWSPAPRVAVRGADLDGDGRDELVLGSDLQVIAFVRARGGFDLGTERLFPYLPLSFTHPAIGDIDGDGDMDLIAHEHVFLGDGAGAFVASGGHFPGGVQGLRGSLPDVDADGDLDLLTEQGLWRNDGRATFTPWFRVSGMNPVAGDIDNDGDLDLALPVNLAQLRLYENLGASGFVDVSARLPATVTTRSAAFADVDGDGFSDLATSATATMPLCGGLGRLFLNDGRGGFVDGTAGLSVATTCNSGVAADDLDGDADLDLVFTSTPSIQICINDGRALRGALPPG
jgi:hypothetical protein